jgi:rsbT co-antagonist protein RsbR
MPTNEPEQSGAAVLLMRDMAIDEASIERRKKIVGLVPDDLTRIDSIKELVRSRAARYTQAFFEHLSVLEEARPLLVSRELSERARELQREHVMELVSGDYGKAYVVQRLALGQLYARAGLETRVYLAAFHHLLRQIGTDVIQQNERNPSQGFESFMSLKKIAFFDIGIVVDVLVYERERVIRQQQEAIRELSTPVLQIRDRMLLLPIIGVIDTHRARKITASLLNAVRDNRAKVVVMDITGVATVDSRVANHILQTVSAARLMGASVIVTGITSDVAQSLVALGIELGELSTVGDLQGGLEEAERILGLRVVHSDVTPVCAGR